MSGKEKWRSRGLGVARVAVQEVTAQAWPLLPVFAITTSKCGARGSVLSSSDRLASKMLRWQIQACLVPLTGVGGLWEEWCRGETSGVSAVALATPLMSGAAHKMKRFSCHYLCPKIDECLKGVVSSLVRQDRNPPHRSTILRCTGRFTLACCCTRTHFPHQI